MRALHACTAATFACADAARPNKTTNGRRKGNVLPRDVMIHAGVARSPEVKTAVLRASMLLSLEPTSLLMCCPMNGRWSAARRRRLSFSKRGADGCTLELMLAQDYETLQPT